MSEFGHNASIGPNLCIDSWGIGPFIITDENGKQWRFEDSDRFGPFILGKKGDPLASQPGERSPFWRVHSIWVQQGRRVEDEINCLWNEPKPTTVRMLSKRVGVVVENGEENGKTIVIRDPVGVVQKP